MLEDTHKIRENTKEERGGERGGEGEEEGEKSTKYGFHPGTRNQGFRTSRYVCEIRFCYVLIFVCFQTKPQRPFLTG